MFTRISFFSIKIEIPSTAETTQTTESFTTEITAQFTKEEISMLQYSVLLINHFRSIHRIATPNFNLPTGFISHSHTQKQELLVPHTPRVKNNQDQIDSDK